MVPTRKGGGSRLGLENGTWTLFNHVHFSKSIYTYRFAFMIRPIFLPSRSITIGHPDNLNFPSKVHLGGWCQPRKGGGSRLGLENGTWSLFDHVPFSKSIYILFFYNFIFLLLCDNPHFIE
jgi:hypothetical protein